MWTEDTILYVQNNWGALLFFAAILGVIAYLTIKKRMEERKKIQQAMVESAPKLPEKVNLPAELKDDISEQKLTLLFEKSERLKTQYKAAQEEEKKYKERGELVYQEWQKVRDDYNYMKARIDGKA